MISLGERVIGVLKNRGFDVSVVKENQAVSAGLLIDPLRNPRVICADTRVNSGDPDYTRNLKLIGGAHLPPAVLFGGNEQGYRESVRLFSENGVVPAIHVGEDGDPHDCKMFKLWVHDHLSGVHKLELTGGQLGNLLSDMDVRTERLEGHPARDIIVNLVSGSTIDKARAPRSLAVDHWFAEKLGVGAGHLDILAQAGEYLFKGEVIHARIVL